jgi:uncharacterized membrane protein (DUF106 family)
MWILNVLFGKIFVFLFLPLLGLGPWAGMAVVSLLTAVLMLFIFRLTSNQAGIKKVKNRIKAHLLEIRLYNDNFGVSLKAQGNILLANLRYVGYNLKPMLVMIVPLILILIQLNLWFGSSSLQPGQAAVLKMKLEKSRNPLEMKVSIQPTPNLLLETPPVRIEDEHEISWRLRARDKGKASLAITAGSYSFSKEVSIAQRPLSRISPVKPGGNLIDMILHPGEEPIPKGAGIKAVEISYPAKNMDVFGLGIHWLIVYFVLSIVFGFALKGFFKVEI